MELFGLIGYGLASFAYLVFILLLLAARNNTIAGRLVLGASAFTLLSFLIGAFQIQQGFSLKIVLLVETFKFPIWALLLLSTRERLTSIRCLVTHKKSREFMVFWLIISAVFWGISVYGIEGDNSLFLLFLIFNLWQLVLLEQLYRNADVKAKWALLPLVIALGAMNVYEFILFAQASMLKQLDFNLWYVRSVIAIIAVPFLLISTRRMKDWSVNVFISREVVFYSSILMITGMYLLIMALVGYTLNYLGGRWGNMFSVAFLVMGGLVLAGLLITEKLRREVKVFITKHFFANKYDYRVEWLNLIEQLEISESVDYYSTSLQTICSTLKISKGLLIKKHALGQYKVLSHNGINYDDTLTKEVTLVDQYCEEKAWIIDIAEYQQVENSYAELFIDTQVFLEASVAIIVPIVVNRKIYGFFLLSSPHEGKRLLNWEDRDLLTSISKQLSHYMTLNEASDALSQAKQFDAFNRMSAFLVHDLKNVQAQLGLIATNAVKHRNNPEFIDDVFETVDSATHRLDKMLQQLRNKQVEESEKRTVSLSDIVHKVINQRNVNLPIVTAELNCDYELEIDSEKFSSVLNHLIQNAQEATSDNGWVKIVANNVPNHFQLEISDNGEGMSSDFIKQRLFKPFDTTKGNAGMGIGVFEAKQFIENEGGTLSVVSKPKEGTTFKVLIPMKSHL